MAQPGLANIFNSSADADTSVTTWEQNSHFVCSAGVGCHYAI